MDTLCAVLIFIALVCLLGHFANNWPLSYAVVCVVLERLLALWPLRFLGVVVLVVGLPAAAQAQSVLDRAIDLANGSAVFMHGADATTTVFCHAKGTCVEANRLIRPFVGGEDPKLPGFLAIKGATALGAYLVKQRTRRSQPEWTLVASIAENVALTWITIHNYRVHQRASR